MHVYIITYIYSSITAVTNAVKTYKQKQLVTLDLVVFFLQLVIKSCRLCVGE